MRIARVLCGLGLIFLLCYPCVQSAEAADSKPFTVKLVNKPPILKRGTKQVFTVEIKNRLNVPLTLSSLHFFDWSIDWTNPDGSGQGAFSGSGGKTIVRTNIDPVSGAIECKYYHYETSDFFTLSPRASKRFDILVDVPTDCFAPIANIRIDFESKYDGSEVGLVAWTGKGPSLKLTIPVKNPRRH
jgi:hypothetical protein